MRIAGIGMVLLAGAVVLACGPPDWQATIDRVAPGVVELRVSVPRPFDADSAGFQTATGFVVDARRGLILTNRHVVTPGPVVAEAVFLNNEEVEVEAIYRDPVHDFGFYRFDPEDVQFMDVIELELAPERAKVGADLRVIGNDAGEKLSILAGTLARVDRAAPVYGRTGYNDFNTFYYQAASGTSGGSSGSPVIDRRGKVMALNAGGKRLAASSFYLPLDRVVRALDAIREGRPVARGTIEVVFAHESFDEIRRLGLRPEVEESVRVAFPDSTGMIVVDEIVPGGSADQRLEEGDVVVKVNGRTVTTFLPIEEILDDNVGESVRFEVERGGEPLAVDLAVADLHAITPSSYLEVGGAVLHPLSYHAARNHGVPVEGVYVAAPGYMFSDAGVPKGALIQQIDGRPVSTLDELEEVLGSIPDGEEVTLRFVRLQRPNSPAVAVIRMDRRWFDLRQCHRDDVEGRWPCVEAPPPPPGSPTEVASTQLSVSDDRPLRDLAPSMVLVEFQIPFQLDGVHADRFAGAGLVVDATQGLVVVDRETVPIALGDLMLTFGGAVRVPGQIVYLHPEHNFAVIRYDPEHIGDTPVESARLKTRKLAPGEPVWVVGYSPAARLVSRETRIDRLEPLTLPLTRPPRFRDHNIELVALEDFPPTLGGVVSNDQGEVLALWASFFASVGPNPEPFFAGIPVERILPVVTALIEGRAADWRSLGVEFQPLNLAEARQRGLAEKFAKEIEAHDPQNRQVLSVVRVAAASPAAERLREGDLVLEVNGETVTRFDELESASQASELELRVLRDGEEIALEVPTVALSGTGTERAVLWAGALIQQPHWALPMQWGLPREGVYVARYWYGSPANRYGLGATRRIVAIDGRPTPDLDEFLAAVAQKPDRGPVRIKVVSLDGKVEVITLKLDLAYWPTIVFERGEEGWQRARLGAEEVGPAAS